MARSNINITTAGENILVNAAANEVVEVTAIVLVFDSATIVTFKSGSTAASGPMTFAAGGGVVLDPKKSIASNERNWFITAVGEDFVLSMTDNCNVGGWIEYKIHKLGVR